MVSAPVAASVPALPKGATPAALVSTDPLRHAAVASAAATHVKEGGDAVKPRLTDEEMTALKQQKAWEVALGPAKSVPLNGFMLWMSGNTIQVFSVMVTAMMFYNALKAIVGVESHFSRFQDNDSSAQVSRAGATDKATLRVSSGPISQLVGRAKVLMSDPLVLQKLAFMGLQFALCGLGLYKMSTMGLLPTATSDWLSFEKYRPFLEISVHGLF